MLWISASASYVCAAEQIENIHSIISVLVCFPGWRREAAFKLWYSYLVVMLHSRHDVRILQCAGTPRILRVGRETLEDLRITWVRGDVGTWGREFCLWHNVWRGGRAWPNYERVFPTINESGECRRLHSMPLRRRRAGVVIEPDSRLQHLPGRVSRTCCASQQQKLRVTLFASGSAQEHRTGVVS